MGQIQKVKKINEPQFEQDAWNLSVKFDAAEWNNFAQFLTQHVANQAYAKYLPNQITWVLVMRMLRNIMAHESSVLFVGLKQCLRKVVKYTRTEDNFRALLDAEERNIIP